MPSPVVRGWLDEAWAFLPLMTDIPSMPIVGSADALSDREVIAERKTGVGLRGISRFWNDFLDREPLR